MDLPSRVENWTMPSSSQNADGHRKGINANKDQRLKALQPEN